MNHLAHLYLAGHSHGLIVGGFIADQVKGLIPGTYSEEVRKGIQLHRMIDAFTDSHNLVRQAQRLLPKSFGRSRGIIIDVFFDHLLAEDFQIISGQQLATFSMEMQTILKKHNELLPANWAEFFSQSYSANWLYYYQDLSHCEFILQKIAARKRFLPDFTGVSHLLSDHKEALRELFQLFFPILDEFVQASKSN
jgi:acyl carrier protein phosphodiesterase